MQAKMHYIAAVRLASLATVAVAVWMLVISFLFATDIWQNATQDTLVALAIVDGILAGGLVLAFAGAIWGATDRGGAPQAVKKNTPTLMGLLLVISVVLHIVIPATTYGVYAARGYSMASIARPAHVLVAQTWQNMHLLRMMPYLLLLVLAIQTLQALKRPRAAAGEDKPGVYRERARL